MSNQQHDYHLVNPSAFPILASMSLIFVAFGAVMAMHDKPYGAYVFAAGLLSVIYVSYRWWREVIIEGDRDNAHTSIVQHGLRLGMVLFITSEVMFFGAFFASFFKSSLIPSDILGDIWPIAQGIWPPAGIETFSAWGLPALNTLILLLSSATASDAHHAVVHNRQDVAVKYLIATVALGFTFSLLQAYEYHHAAFGFTDGVYASNFYMATGFHGAHVIIGTLFLLVCLVRARKRKFTPEAHLGLEFACWYWHFVDAVWLFLFVWVYIWGGN